MKKRIAIILSIMLMLSLLLSACTPKNPPADNKPIDNTKPTDPPKTTDPEKQKVLTIGTPYTIDTFLPYKFTSDGDRYVISNIYEALIEDDTGAFIPGLAESWTYPDDKTYEFKLRDNAYWQTGNDLFKDEKVKVTANDVKASFDFVLDDKNKSPARANFSNLDKIEVVSDSTIRFYTKEPSAMFMKYLSNILIFPTKAIETNFDLNKSPVGSGAFKFKEYKTDDQAVLVRNDDFFIKPNLDKVIFKIIPDKAVAAIALRNKEIDIVPQLLSTDLEAVSKESYLELVPNSAGWYRYLGFNTSDPLFTDINVRLAIRKAIDFEGITEAIFANNLGAQIAIPAYGPVPPEFVGYNPDAWKKEYEFNPDKAKKLLEDAGWAKGSDGIYAKDGTKLKFIMKTPANDPNRMKFGDMCATYLKQIGIDCSTQPTEWATHLADIKAGNTQMFIMGGGSTMDGLNMLFHSVGASTQSHNTFLKDPELDALIDKAFSTIDETKRKPILEEASLKAVLDCVHAGGYVEYVQVGINSRVSGFGEKPTLWYGLTTATRNVGIGD